MNHFSDLHQISGKEYIFISKKYIKTDEESVYLINLNIC